MFAPRLYLPLLLPPLRGWAERAQIASRDRRGLALLGLAGVLAAWLLPAGLAAAGLAAIGAVAGAWWAGDEISKLINSVPARGEAQLRLRLSAPAAPACHPAKPPLRPPRLAV